MENIKYSYALTKIMSLFTSVVLQKKTSVIILIAVYNIIKL